jgi:hypothetical protein
VDPSDTSPDRTKIVVTNATTVIKVMARHDRLGFMVQGSSAPPQNAFGGIDRSVEALVADLRRPPPPALDAPTALRAQD